MKNTIYLLAFLLFSTTTFSQTILDQQEVGAGGSQVAIYDPLGPSYTPRGQSFTAGITGNLSSFEITTRVLSSCDSFRVSFYSGSSNFGAFLQSEIFSVGDFAPLTNYQFNITPAIQIFSGAQYSFYIDTVFCPANLEQIQIVSNSIGGYSGGGMFDQFGSPVSTFDMNFKTSVTCNLYASYGDGSDVDCYGDTTGVLDIYVANENFPTNIVWNYQGMTGSTISPLPAGTYSCTLTDNAGCVGTYSYTIPQPTQVQVGATSSDVTCFGFDDGTALMGIPTGGAGQYNQYWSNGASGASVSNLPPGQIIAFVNDALGCLDSVVLMINTPPQMVMNFNTFQPTCGLSDGSIVANVTGGTAPLDLYWSTGDTINTIINIGSGFYQLEIVDANGCYYSDVQSLNDASGPSIATNAVTDLLCNGTNSGAIDVAVSGGLTPYTYSWSNNEATEDISGLSGGHYDLAVIDANGCFASAFFMVNEPDPIYFNPYSTASSCGSLDGTASISPGGATSPYSVVWDVTASSQTTYTATGLAAGLYTVVLTDANGCVDSTSVGVTDWNGPYIQVDSVKNAGCANGAFGNGEIHLTTYGNPAFTYAWSNGANTEDVTSLGSGMHAVLVTDGSGCKASHVEYLYGIVPGTPQICMTTVDTATNRNVIVWEKNVPGILNYKIYREGTLPGNFNHIATIPADSLSEFKDTVANSDVKSWKYELRATDSCGKVSTFSLTHKPIHLSAVLGTTNEVVLNWDQYQGFAYNQYYIFREHFTTGWQLIDSTLNGVTNYTDFSAPAPVDSCHYLIEVYPSAPCVSTRGVINTTRSNIKTPSSRVNGIKSNLIEDMSWTLYPNPNSGEFKIRLNEKTEKITKLSVMDNLGRVVFTKNVAAGISTENVSVSSLDAGVYFVKLEINTKVQVKRLVISK